MCKQWLYIGELLLPLIEWAAAAHGILGIAIVLATINLLLGIVSLSYMSPKKDGLWAVKYAMRTLLMI